MDGPLQVFHGLEGTAKLVHRCLWAETPAEQWIVHRSHKCIL